MASKTGCKETIHILSNISRSKDNSAMKLGQLTEHNLRYTFLEKSCQKCVGETTYLGKILEKR